MVYTLRPSQTKNQSKHSTEAMAHVETETQALFKYYERDEDSRGDRGMTDKN